MSNDPERPETIVQVSWKAVAALEFVPANLDFGSIRPGETIERSVEIVKRGPGNDGTLGPAAASPPASLSARLDGRKLRVAVRAGEAYGPGAGVVTVPADAGPVEVLSLPVRWTVADSVEVSPRRLFLGAGGASAECIGRLVLTARDGPLDVTTIEAVDLPGATAAVQPAKNHRVVAIEVRWRLPEAPGHHAGRIVIRCRQPEERILDVPVSAFVAADVTEREETP